MSRGWLRTLSVLAITLVLLECKPAVPLRSQFACVANIDSNDISAYGIGSNGALKPLPGSPFAARVKLTSVAITRLLPLSHDETE
jgi:hypothetical protein